MGVQIEGSDFLKVSPEEKKLILNELAKADLFEVRPQLLASLGDSLSII